MENENGVLSASGTGLNPVTKMILFSQANPLATKIMPSCWRYNPLLFLNLRASKTIAKKTKANA